MLNVVNYSVEYINHCRLNIQAQLQTYQQMIAVAPSSDFKQARVRFESHFFCNMIILLESYFIHRSRNNEKRDGNPLNQVRMISASLMNNHGIMTGDKSIAYNPEKAVLKIPVGAQVRIDQAGFEKLSEAFLKEIEKKYC